MKDFSLKEYMMNYVLPDFLDHCSQGVSKKGRQSYVFALTEFLGKYPNYSDYTLENCYQYFEYLRDKQNNKHDTCVKKRRQLSKIFRYAYDNLDNYKELPSSFTNFFPEVPPTGKESVIQFDRTISLSELDKLVTYTKKNDRLCFLAILFSFKMLLKVSEFLKLQFSDICVEADDYDIFDSTRTRVLTVRSSRGKRYMPLPSDIYREICDYEDRLPNSPVHIFASDIVENGVDRPLSDRTMISHLRKATDELGLRAYTYNDLRNSGIAFAASRKCPEELLVNAVNMKSDSHITRLTSLSSLTFEDSVENYIGIQFTGNTGKKTEDRTEEENENPMVIMDEEQRIEYKVEKFKQQKTDLEYGVWCVTAMQNILEHKLYPSEDVRRAFYNAHKKIRWYEDIFSSLDYGMRPGYETYDTFFEQCMIKFISLNPFLRRESREVQELVFSDYKKIKGFFEKACDELGKDTIMKKLLQNVI